MSFARELVLQVFYRAVADALLGSKRAKTWLKSSATDVLERIGCTGLAKVGPDVWLEANAVELAAAMHLEAHCRTCLGLYCENGRCICLAKQWEAQGRAPEYAESTVKHDSKGFLRVCIYYEEDKPNGRH